PRTSTSRTPPRATASSALSSASSSRSRPSIDAGYSRDSPDVAAAMPWDGVCMTTLARTFNERTWHASGAALYGGDIDAFLAYWEAERRHRGGYPAGGS